MNPSSLPLGVDAAALWLPLAGFVAAFIDAQVGGGGVITLPALLAAGLPPHMALGTNKLGGTVSALVASGNYLRSGAVPIRQALLFAPFAFVGGAVGVWAVLRSDATWLIPVVLAVMATMTLYVLVRPRFGASDTPVVGRAAWFAMALAALDIGTYDGLLGPGTGSLALFACVALLGYGFRRAAALGRILNLASNVSALSYFLWVGAVDFRIGIPMAVAMAGGAYLGSHVTLRHGDKYLKPLFVAVAVVLMVRLAARL